MVGVAKRRPDRAIARCRQRNPSRELQNFVCPGHDWVSRRQTGTYLRQNSVAAGGAWPATRPAERLSISLYILFPSLFRLLLREPAPQARRQNSSVAPTRTASGRASSGWLTQAAEAGRPPPPRLQQRLAPRRLALLSWSFSLLGKRPKRDGSHPASAQNCKLRTLSAWPPIACRPP